MSKRLKTPPYPGHKFIRGRRGRDVTRINLPRGGVGFVATTVPGEVLAALAEALYCEHPYGEGSGDAAGGRPRLWVWLSQGLEPVAARPPIVLRRVDLSDISEAFPVARR